MTQVLAASVRFLVERRGAGADRRTIRRAVLVERGSGKLIELPTVYVLRTNGQKSLNTQVASLRDLAFFHEWCLLKQSLNQKWKTPAERIKARQVPLANREVSDYARWCAFKAPDLVKARVVHAKGANRLAVGSPVRAATVNRRLKNALLFLQWQVEEFTDGSFEDFAIAGELRLQLCEAFDSEMHKEMAVLLVRALTNEQKRSLEVALDRSELFNGSTGVRDKLLIRLLLQSGLRAGELLKLQCADVSDDFRLTDGKTIGFVEVIRRPNDRFDERVCEPSVKSYPGCVPIPRSLARDLLLYVRNERRSAVEERQSGDTPYLFVCHVGAQKGKPLSQRNLNRIVGKLKRITNIPSWISPHAMRHTHFSSLADSAYSKGIDPLPLLNNRGRWSQRSGTAERYIQRPLQEEAAKVTAIRDQLLEAEE